MPRDRFEARRNKLRRKLRQSGCKAILVTDETNVSWLTGFSGDSSYLLLSADLTLMLSDTRYTVQIAEECPGLEAEIRDSRVHMHDKVTEVVKQAGLTQIGFESDTLPHAEWERLRDGVKSLELIPTEGLTLDLRQVKDAVEIGEIRKAVWLAERAFAVLRSTLRPEQTELEIAHNLEHAMRGFGAEGAGFDPIVAVGPRAALPHARPGLYRVEESSILLIDWGAETTSRYRSDLTRVLFTGKISPKVEKVYGVVLRAQRAAIAAIRPGVRCDAVDKKARELIDRAGYGKYFGHGLGHGIGLQIHEQPRFSPISQQVLEPGMVVTVEPGIYLPGWGGIRIEDDVLVTKDGCEVLTSVSKEFEEAFVEFLAT